MSPDEIGVTSTSAWSASVDPLVLRGGDQTRLVFLPELIENTAEPRARVKGVLVWQRKTAGGAWEPYDAIKLNELKGGEGVHLDLRSAEVMALYDGLTDYYAIGEEHGVPSGNRRFVRAPESEQLRSLLKSGNLDALLAEDATGLLPRFIGWFASQSASDLSQRLAGEGSADLVNFDAAIGGARLQAYLNDYEQNSRSDNEQYWHGLLKKHSWVLSQVYAQPLVLIEDEAYVGGKQVTNQRGSVADFLYQNGITQNVALVEIKTAATSLLYPSPYRNNAFAPHRDLTAATQQLLVDKSLLIETYRTLSGDADLTFRAFNPKALLIVGDMSALPADPSARRSFELFRNNQREIDIVTFDELATKVRLLLGLLNT